MGCDFKEIVFVNLRSLKRVCLGAPVIVFKLFFNLCLDPQISISAGMFDSLEPNKNIPIVVTIMVQRNISLVNLVLNYGDGYSEERILPWVYSIPSGTISEFYHQYTQQGKYKVTADLLHDGKSYSAERLIDVWENLLVILIAPKSAFPAGEEIQLKLYYVPRYNFRYTIDFGNNQTIFYKRGTYQDEYTHETSFSQTYYNPGTYKIVFIAWNDKYTKENSLNIDIQVRIPYDSLSLQPKTETIPLPDGRIELILEYSSSEPEPTSVVCNYDFGDSREVENVLFTNNSYIVKEHIYSTAGTKNVEFVCSNDVSSEKVESVITVRSYNLREFIFSYENPTPMSMTLERVSPTKEYRHYYRSVTVPVNVTFNISLQDFRWFPPGIHVTWDYDDETTPDIFVLKHKRRTHQFSSTRRAYRMTVKMVDSNSGAIFIHYLTIRLGVIHFSCYPTSFDLRFENITLIAFGIEGIASYTFLPDADTLILPYPGFDYAMNNVNMMKPIYKNMARYFHFGFYMPSVLGSNGEVVIVDQPIIADMSLLDGLDLVIQPHLIPLPPGKTTFIIKLKSGQRDRPFTHCNMTAGDAVDRDSVFYKEQNITSLHPLIFDYTYTSLGNHTATIVCTNYISHKKWVRQVAVMNKCFDYNGIYDRQYSVPKEPMHVLTSEKIYIANKMHIMCDELPVFKWTFFKGSSIGKTNVTISYKNPMKPLKGRLLIKDRTFYEGLYYLLLNVTLQKTWITEYTYINFWKKKPSVYIDGGNHRIALRNENITFKARGSHGPLGEYGESLGLEFSWNCKRYE